jgi:hypothetical protein
MAREITANLLLCHTNQIDQTNTNTYRETVEEVLSIVLERTTSATTTPNHTTKVDKSRRETKEGRK